MLRKAIFVFSFLLIVTCAGLAVARLADFPDYWMITQDDANRHLSVAAPDGTVQWEIEPVYVNPTLVYYLRGRLLYIESNGTVLWSTRVDGKLRRSLLNDTRFFPYYTTATDYYRVFIYRTPANGYRVLLTDGKELNAFYSPNLIFTPTLWSGDKQTLYIETAVNQAFVSNIVAIDVATSHGDYVRPGQVSYGLARDNRFIFQWQRRWWLNDGSELMFEPDTVMLDWIEKNTLLIGLQGDGQWELFRASLDGMTKTKLLDAGLPPLARYNNWLYIHTPEQSLVRFNLQTSAVETLIERAVIFEEARDYTPIDPLLIYTNVFFVQDHRWIITSMQDGDSFHLVRINPDGSDRKILHTYHDSDTVRLHLSADEQWLILDSLYADDMLRINITSGDVQEIPVQTFLFSISTFEDTWHALELSVSAVVVLMMLFGVGWVRPLAEN